jgi:hypothetical protein
VVFEAGPYQRRDFIYRFFRQRTAIIYPHQFYRDADNDWRRLSGQVDGGKNYGPVGPKK